MDNLDQLLTMKNLRSEDGLRACFNAANGGPAVYCQQNPDEMLAFLEDCLKLTPQHVCEIGTAGGGTTYLLSRITRQPSRIATVDIGISADSAVPARLDLLALEHQEIWLIVGNSQDQAVVSKVADFLSGYIDVLFIDGDHKADTVAEDFRNYGSMVRHGGLVGFHDIAFKEPGFVSDYWQKLKDLYETWEYSFLRGHLGIGVLRMDTTVEKP